MLTKSKLPTNPLRPVKTNNACPPRFTAAAGTKLAGTSFVLKSKIFKHRKGFTT